GTRMFTPVVVRRWRGDLLPNPSNLPRHRARSCHTRPVRYVALLRGVNLGKRRIGMADLRSLLGSLGFADVATYLQSGNAVFSSADPATDVRSRIGAALADAYGFDVPTLLRPGAEIRAVIDGCPYRDDGDADPTKVH